MRSRKYKIDLESDTLGNLNRIENETAKLPLKLVAAKTRKAETLTNPETV